MIFSVFNTVVFFVFVGGGGGISTEYTNIRNDCTVKYHSGSGKFVRYVKFSLII